MSPRSAAEIAFAVTGIYLITSGVSYGVMSLEFALAPKEAFGNQWASQIGTLRWLNTLGPAVFVAFGVALVAFRKRLSARFVEQRGDEEGGNGTAGAQGAAISVLGVYFLAEGLTTLLRDGAFWKLGGLGGEPSVRELCEGAARVVVGGALFLGARGIVGFWMSLRRAALPKE